MSERHFYNLVSKYPKEYINFYYFEIRLYKNHMKGLNMSLPLVFDSFE